MSSNPETSTNRQTSFAPETAEMHNSSPEGSLGYDVPRPALTLAQAAAVLGKSMRSLERSLTGRWGNKLPEGWSAKKRKTEKGEEWTLIPPPGFRIRQGNAPENMTRMVEVTAEPPGTSRLLMPPKRTPWRAENHRLDYPTIVIDRSEEVENLLRELVSVQKSLSEERRLHMEDMRIISQMQGSLRLLETNASESSRIKAELESTKKELEELKRDYNYVVNLPWWKRLLASFTK